MDRKSDILAAIAVTLPAFFFFRQLVFQHLIPRSPDIFNMMIPLYSFARESIRRGELPLWNPYSASGIPFLADPQSSVLYPLSLFHYIMPLAKSVPIAIFLHYLLAAFFMYLFARQIGSSVFGSIFAALTFAYSGHYLALSWGLTLLGSILWVPLIFACCERAVKQESPWWISLAGLAWAFQVFAGSLQVPYYTALAVGAYLLFRMGSESLPLIRKRRISPRLLSLPFLFGLFALAFASLQLVPTLEYVPLSNLAGGYSEEIVGRLNIIPELRILFGQKHAWVEGVFVYAGGACLLLAASALFVRGNRYTIFFAVVAIVALSLAFGDRFFTATLLNRLAPGFAEIHAHWPTRVLFLYMFSLSSLAAQSLTQMEENGGWVFLRRFTLTSLAVYLTGWLFFDPRISVFSKGVIPAVDMIPLLIFSFFAFSTVILVVWRQVGLVKGHTFKILLITLVLIDLFNVYNRLGLSFASLEQILAESRPVQFLLREEKETEQRNLLDQRRIIAFDPYRQYGFTIKPEILSPNFGLFHRIPDAQNYGPLCLQRYRTLVDYANGEKWDYHLTVFNQGNLQKRRILNLLSVGYLLVPTGSTEQLSLGSLGWRRIYTDKQTSVFHNPQAFPRAFMVYNATVLSDPAQILREVVEGTTDLRHNVFIQAKSAKQEEISSISLDEPATTSSILFERPSPQQMYFEVNTPVDGFLVVNESCHPSWQATVDGVKQNVYIANYALQAIFLTAGSHSVMIKYETNSFHYAIVILLLALVLSTGLAIWERRTSVSCLARQPANKQSGVSVDWQ